MHTSGRPINVSSFGGAPGQGTLIASGCQDGDIKVSVLRDVDELIVFADYNHPAGHPA